MSKKRDPKKWPRKCIRPHCRGIVTKAQKNLLCPRCKIRRWNERYPLQRAFHNLRSHAKERGKDFSLTFEQFKVFAEKTEYMKYRGKRSWSFSIDRKDNSKGYCESNIQCITMRENSRKEWVPYFAKQMQNSGYKPTAEEIADAERAMEESMK